MRELRCCKLQFFRWKTSGRIKTLLVILLFFTYSMTNRIILAARTEGLPTSLWLFPHMFRDRYMILCYMLCVLLLFCDAPFLDQQQVYVISRIGKRRWAAGTILYICAASMVFFLSIWTFTVIAFLPTLQASFSWGTLFSVLQYRNPYTGQISGQILSAYSPLEASLLALLLTWQAGVFLGLLLYRCNLRYNRAAGLLLAGAFAFMDFLILVMLDDRVWALYISPISWVNLEILGVSDAPPIWYGILGFLCINGSLACLCVREGSKFEPQRLEELT